MSDFRLCKYYQLGKAPRECGFGVRGCFVCKPEEQMSMDLIYSFDRMSFYHGDSRNLDRIKDQEIGLVVTSPPYFNAREYTQWATYGEYFTDMRKVYSEVYRVLVPGGRICVNVPSVYGRNAKGTLCYPIESDTIHALMAVGFELRGVIIWDKGAAVIGGSTSWGSWCSSSNPSLRDQHEVIIVAHKGAPKREKGESTISAENFTNWTRSVWEIPPVSKAWHPAPFPAEIPRRLIELYSYKDDIVLDPFSGSGTTVFAASILGREGIGVELNKEYILKSCGPLLAGEAL